MVKSGAGSRPATGNASSKAGNVPIGAPKPGMAAIAAAQHFVCGAYMAAKAAEARTHILYACADFMRGMRSKSHAAGLYLTQCS
jgi:hypothetical protein